MKSQKATFLTLILILMAYSMTSTLVIPRQRDSPGIQRESVSPSSTIVVNQTVTGTLTYNAQQASYGIHLDPGQYNVTLNVSSSANLGFQMTKWVLADPTFLTVIFVSPPGLYRNSSGLLLVPTIPANTPGDYVIRIFPLSAATLGSFWLQVRQISSFQPLPTDRHQGFTLWSSPRALLFEAMIDQFGTYNFTLTTNSSSIIGITTYEDDIYLPFFSTSAGGGRMSFLAPLRSGDLYIEATTSAAVNLRLTGSLSLNLTSTPTLSPGSTVQGTVPLDQQVYFYANMTPGYYYNIVLQVPAGQNLDLFVYSPTTSNPALAQSTQGLGLGENITNLVVFYSRTYSVNAAGAYQTSNSQSQSDRVLIGVRNVTVTSPTLMPFNLTLTRQPFPILAPGAQAKVYLNSTRGPFYQFYSAPQFSPAVFNITYQHTVWGQVPWSGVLALVAAEKVGKLATTPSTGLLPFYNQHIFFTPQSFQYAAEHWIGEGITNSTLDSNTLSHNFTMGIPPFAYMDSSPMFIGAVLRGVAGQLVYNGTLSYMENPGSALSIGVNQSDFLPAGGINLFRVNFKAGHTYKVSLQYSNTAILSAIYNSTGYMQPTNPPTSSLFIVSDPGVPNNGYYYLFTPTVTNDYYLTDSGPFFFTSPGGSSYSLRIQESTPPTLSLGISGPSSQKVGQKLNITATITNNGDYDADNVAISLSLPLGLTTLNTPTTDLGTLAPHASTQVTWTLNSTTPGNVIIIIQASSSNTQSVMASKSLLVTAPSLQVTILAPASASPGASFPVQISVKNNGNATAGQITVALILPSGLSSSSSTQTISSLNPGQTQTLTWNVNADSSGDYTITATANEQYAGSTTITASMSVPPPWQYYLFGGILGSLVVAFILGVLFESRRESRRNGTRLPPPPAASK